MKQITGSLEQARIIVEWLATNVAKNSKAKLSPSYGSWMNDTLRWDAQNRSWYVEFKPRKNLIIIECNNTEVELMALLIT